MSEQQVNIATDNAHIYAVQNGNQYVYSYQHNPPYEVASFSIMAAPIPDQVVRRAPSWLLAAPHRVVAFTGRKTELSSLTAWRDSPESRISVRLIHAPGGHGKTRLAMRFAELSIEDGWAVAAARHRSEVVALHRDGEQLTVQQPGLLIVIDYAERWPLQDLIMLIREHNYASTTALRVLLLARPAGGWWESLTYQMTKLGITEFSELEMGPIVEGPRARAAIFGEARDRFAEILQVRGADQIGPPVDLGNDAYSMVLAVHMAALVAVYEGVGGPTALVDADVSALSSYLLDRERNYWQSLYDDGRGPVKTSPSTMARAVYTATLVGPIRYDDSLAALDRVGIVNPGEQILGDHSRCYPTDNPRVVLAPLYPDRLGEDYLALQTPGHSAQSHQPDGWADTAIGKLLSFAGDEAPPWTRSALTVIIEAARRWPHMREYQLWPLLRHSPQLAIAAGSSVLIGLTELPPVDFEVLEAIEAAFPEHQQADLDAGIAAITQYLTDIRLAATSDPLQRARLRRELAYRLGNAGLHDRAAAELRMAVQIYRGMCNAGPSAFEGELASSLDELSVEFWHLGQYEEALTTSSEAVEIFKRLVNKGGAQHLDALARSLNNLSIWLIAVGQPDAALSRIQESVEIYLRLPRSKSTTPLPGFASALTNLGIAFAKLGHRDEALTATREAVETYESLAENNPSAYGPSLAKALTNLAADLSDAGRHEESILISERALRWHRQLVAANAKAHEPDFARGLATLSAALSRAGRPEEALSATREAVEVLRRLAAVNPGAYEGQLAESLTSLTVDLLEASQWVEAVSAAEQAMAMFTILSQRNHDVYKSAVAYAASTLGTALIGVDRLDDSVAYFGKAIKLYRMLAQEQPRMHMSDLAMALSNVINVLIRLNRPRDAIFCIRELLDISRYLGQLNHRQLALQVSKHIVTSCRGLAEVHGPTYEADLGSSLNNLAVMLIELGRPREALAPANEALGIFRARSRNGSPGALPDVLGCLANFSAALLILEELAAASDAATEAFELIRHSTADISSEGKDRVKAALSILASVFGRLNMKAEETEVSTIARSILKEE